MMGEVGREPLVIVEVDLPQCKWTYGTSPCTAVLGTTGARKCYNTRATCQAGAAFDATDNLLTLSFAYNQSGLPKGQTIFPALKSVSTRPSEINLSGIDPKTSALGKRARITVTLEDFAYHDTLTDRYQSQRISGAAQADGIGYDPAERGTFFARLLARNPYYVGKSLRVRYGYVGQDILTMRTAHYVIDGWSGPDAQGVVTITAKDVLDLADNTKAVAPKAAAGKLASAITASDMTATLSPAGIGSQYPTSGRIAIGREVIRYTRSGGTLTFEARGVDGTSAEDHAAGDLVQPCYRADDQRICDVVQDLLVNYAGVPSSFIDIAAWRGEEDAWIAGLRVSATITKPTGVAQLIGELCQHGVMVWWDEIGQQIRYRVNRPLAPGETFTDITDEAHIITGTPEVTRAEDQRATSVFFWHGVIDPTDGAENARNFDKLAVATVTNDRYGQERVKELFSRWFGRVGNDAAAAIIAERLLSRYRDTPRVLSASLDVKDREAIALASLIRVQSRVLQDDTGASAPVTMQVRYVEEDSGRVQISAESFTLEGRFGYWLNAASDYDTATDEEKAEGAYWMDDTIGTFPDGTGPYVYF